MEMASTSGRIEVEKFNGTNFELWKLKIEDMLVDRDLWESVNGTKLAVMSQANWYLKDRKAKGLIRLSLVDSILLNVHEEKTVNLLWKKLGDVYQAKSLVNKLFSKKEVIFLSNGGWRIHS